MRCAGRRLISGLLRDPIEVLETLSAEARGRIVELKLGPFTAYLATHPEHLKHILKGNSPNYVREGLLWQPMRRLLGDGIVTANGASWERSRKSMQPFFTRRHVTAIGGSVTRTIAEQVDLLHDDAQAGKPVDTLTEISRILRVVFMRILCGDRISFDAAARLAQSCDAATESIKARLLFPFMPNTIPLPGDRAFQRATREIDDIIYPLMAETEHRPGDDVISALCHEPEVKTDEAARRKVRDNLINLIGASLETSARNLTWVWPMLHKHPALAGRVYDEIARVVGDGPVTPEHVEQLTYLRAFLREVLRLYPSGWLFSRTAVMDDTIDGVRIQGGATMLLSPYLTHRLEEFWDDPLAFDPGRFAENAPRRAPYSYVPFGVGPRSCIGEHLFMTSGMLTVATILSKYRTEIREGATFTPAAGASLRMRESVALTLLPLRDLSKGQD
ncbi:cytochrome P450 [Sinosporangium siamense]|uniref:Cytochrome P450 n=2 Tax=Sinosporangium siamense TaxID=1367973 RepID=A0A919RJ68_9ACTN|nr:cytochrome P450 [Sinosporangium siamense]